MIQRKLKPVLERANVTNKLREIRKTIEDIQNKKNKSINDALRVQRLRQLEDETKREHIILVVDNTA